MGGILFIDLRGADLGLDPLQLCGVGPSLQEFFQRRIQRRLGIGVRDAGRRASATMPKVVGSTDRPS
jgi:hypothetical protein